MRRLSDVDLRLLRIFATLVDCNGFRSAQIALGISQSTLSTHLAALEARLGSRLCERGRGGFRLTAAGEETYAAAQELMRGLERFEATMGRVHGRPTGKLRLGVVDAVPTFAALDLPGVLARFAEARPDMLLELDTDTPAGLQKSLISGQRDIVIGPSFQPVPGLAFRDLGSEEHLLYCGAGHPWFIRPDATIAREDVHRVRFSVRSYQHFDDTYRLGRVAARATVGSMEAQELLVLSGAYVGFLPTHLGGRWQAEGRMRAVRPLEWSFQSRFYLAFNPAGEGAAARRAFAGLFDPVPERAARPRDRD